MQTPKGRKGWMDISVIVPTFNRRELVRRALDALFVQSLPPSRFEIIVVVDGSTDGTAEALSSLRPACRFRVIEQENRGLAGARNTGFRAAESNLLLFLDDDMLCEPGLAAAHVAAHRAGVRMAGFGAIFLSPDSRPSLAAECFNREIGASHLQHKSFPGAPLHQVEAVFSNSSIPRALLAEAGGFDESFRMREDLELAVRLFRSGVQARYLPEAVARQFYDKSSADLIRDSEAFAVADTMFARKHPEALDSGYLSWLTKDPPWKRVLRRIAAVYPLAADCVLMPLCLLGEKFFRVPRIRSLGVRALQMRRRIHWFHAALKLGISRLTMPDEPGH